MAVTEDDFIIYNSLNGCVLGRPIITLCFESSTCGHALLASTSFLTISYSEPPAALRTDRLSHGAVKPSD